MTEERLLGFDAREMWSNPAKAFSNSAFWNDELKERCLLKPDVARPFSCDEGVWMPVFDADETLIRPQWTGPIQSFWEDLNKLKQSLDSQWDGEWKKCWIIGLTLFYGLCKNQEKKMWDDTIRNTHPPVRSREWSLIGYDVADRFLTSCLINATPHMDKNQKKQQVNCLNQYHLFEKIDHAIEFKDFANKQAQIHTHAHIHKHAPFFVYALWLIEKRGHSTFEKKVIAPEW